MKSGNLNLLEPSGPLQACNGTAFTFIYTYYTYDKPFIHVIDGVFVEEFYSVSACK
jgi:hypothetical protein